MEKKRLIDVDKAMDVNAFYDCYAPYLMLDDIAELFNDFYVIPKDAPTIEVDPVLHGQWTDPESEEDGTTWWCNGCCHRTFIPKFDKKYDFCPHCGATMDGEAT